MKKLFWRYALIIALGALFLTVYLRGKTGTPAQLDRLPTGIRHLDPLTLRIHAREMARAFKQADTIEVYEVEITPPPPHLSAEKLGEIRKDDDPRRWQLMTEAVARASSGSVAQSIWSLAFVLRKDGKQIALGHLEARDGELAMRIKGRDYGQVWAGEAFRQTLMPYYEQLFEQWRSQNTSTGKPKEVSVAAKPIEFPALKARFVELFEKAGYANIAKPNWPHGVEGVETLGRHAKAWKLMTQGVQGATEGYPLTKTPPEVWISPLPECKPEWLAVNNTELLYTNGILYSEVNELGGMLRTIKPSPEFATGLKMLVDSLKPVALGKDDSTTQQ